MSDKSLLNTVRLNHNNSLYQCSLRNGVIYWISNGYRTSPVKVLEEKDAEYFVNEGFVVVKKKGFFTRRPYWIVSLPVEKLKEDE